VFYGTLFGKATKMNRKIVLLGALTLCTTIVALASDNPPGSSPHKKKTRRRIVAPITANNNTGYGSSDDSGSETGYDGSENGDEE